MKNVHPLINAQKLSVIYRVEPGCLGPDGKNYINEFCHFAQKKVSTLNSDFIVCQILPRNDKSLPEMQYMVVGKTIKYAQADKYLTMFGKSLEQFEGDFADTLAVLIDEFMGHNRL